MSEHDMGSDDPRLMQHKQQFPAEKGRSTKGSILLRDIDNATLCAVRWCKEKR